MISEHRIHFGDSRKMKNVDSQSIHLVVTSPPYPMIEMWDELFCRQASIRKALKRQNGIQAFELMHLQLDRVWDELHRVLAPGGIACINIGDATRTLKDEFALYPNHSRILSHMLGLGFSNLPNILWRKQTNAPNKYMGSGMMPPGAYVTLEHEYILIFRKGDKRGFNTQEKKVNRRRSAFFWEERNQWFSDVWMDLKGARQNTGDKELRARSGAFPFELAYRLICMFSVMGDTVLDPFLGTGTTLFAAAAAGRNGIGYELDKAFQPMIGRGSRQAVEQGRRRIEERLEGHQTFLHERKTAGKSVKYINRVYGFPVVTRQEIELMMPLPVEMRETADNRFEVTYQIPETPPPGDKPPPHPETGRARRNQQLALFD
jgi:DNA modification methylase